MMSTMPPNVNVNTHTGGMSMHPHRRPAMGDVVLHPGPHDVLLGRGGGTNNYCGNIKFRKLVNEHKMRYLTCTKVEKPNVAREVVKLWRRLNPPGRFLAKQDGSKAEIPDESNTPALWVEVGDKKAREKASQCLRERTPDVLPLLRKIKEKEASTNAEAIKRVGDAAAAVTASETDSPVSLSSDKVKTKISDKLNIPDVPIPAAKAITNTNSKSTKAKRASKAQDKDKTRKQARTKSNSSPTQGGRSSPSMSIEHQQQHMSMDNTTGMGQHNVMARRNTMPSGCAPQDPAFAAPTCTSSTTMQDRRSSMPSMYGGAGGMGDPFASLDGSRMGLAMPYAPNASAMMQAYGRGGFVGPMGVGAGAGVPGAAGFANGGAMGPASMGGPVAAFPMPGQTGSMPMEAGAAAGFHNGNPYMDMTMYDPSNPYAGSAQMQQQQFRLQQLRMEQEQLQQQLECQMQMEMEMRRARTATGMMQAPAAGSAYMNAAAANGMMYPHPQQQEAHRGVEAPGFLPEASGADATIDGPLLLDSPQRGRGQEQQDVSMRSARERSDPPSKPVQKKKRRKRSRKAEQEPLPQLPKQEELEAISPTSKIPGTPRVPKQVLNELPSDIPREVSPEVPKEIIGTPHDRNPPSPIFTTDPDGEMTLAEYRKTLDAYMNNHNITREHLYSDDEDNGGANHLHPNAEDLSVQSFVGWKDDDYRLKDESRNESPLRPDPPARDVQPAAVSMEDLRAPIPPSPVARLQQSGHSVDPFRSSFSTNMSVSGLSGVLSRDEGSMEDATAGKRNFSSNESIVSEITVLSNTIDDLDLEDE